ncbi:DNA polymerase III subunit alpha [Lagierella sp.]|uniref:DNA polymerase III subunit alpha n=1 Tax=Lagierella sp. TaxID=2849657 RepID=UPI0026164202|nr:DNA polymerase III subunit alpha [Lagierella sp.]
MNNKFTHLHLHTGYSLLDGFSPIPKLLDYAEELEMDSIAITDHGCMFGVVEFYKEAKKRNIKPIIGCEVYTVDKNYMDKSPQNKNYNHLVLLAENNKGYKNLMKIVSLGYINGFYYKPRVDNEVLREYSEGIICLSACLKGKISVKLVNNDYSGARAAALELEDIFGKGNFFLEVQNHGMKEDEIVISQMERLSKEINIPICATNDVHYIKKEDWRNHKVLLYVQLNKTLDDKTEGEMYYAPGEFYLRSAKEMLELFPGHEEYLENTVKIADRCNVTLDFENMHLPYFQIPKGYTNSEYLRQLSATGALTRYAKVTDEIQSRLNFELNTIEDMGYVDYFLIVSDFIRFAKSKNIPVGPGRGSAAGSLVSYVLGITDIDPLKYNLLFERFLNPERVSMPDIDIDFCYERREEVIDYVVEKYGENKVAQIVTFGTMGARGSIRDVGRVMGMDYSLVDMVAKNVPDLLNMTIEDALDLSPELQKLYNESEEVKNLIDVASDLEGMPRHTSTHAAGVVISKEPIVEYVPLARNKDAIITQFNMTELEELGLLKMDFLGLRNLTVIDDAIKLIEKNRGRTINIDEINVNDPKVINLFNKAETLGIFQFESDGMRNFLSELRPTKFDDLIAANSLFRPGPMNEIPNYIKNKENPQDIKYLHPLLKPILNLTYGTIVYQEQVMQIAQKLAGYSLGAADNLRRAMSKKKMDVMEQERKKFIYGDFDEKENLVIEGALRRGVDEETANQIYDLMIKFANYAFNKSHSAAYSLVAVRTAWLKYYYPVEFMAALLSSVMGSTTKIALYIQECRRLNINILQPDVNYSYKKFSVDGEDIRFGLSAIKNVGTGLIEAIVKVREKGGKFHSFREFIERIASENPQCINKRAIECLIKAGAFSSICKNRNSMMVEHIMIIDSVLKDKKSNIPGQSSLFSKMDNESEGYTDTTYSVKEYPKKELLKYEKEVLGIYLTDHPLKEYEDFIRRTIEFSSLDISSENREAEQKWDKKKVTVAGIITSVFKTLTKTSNEPMAFVTLEDLYGSIDLVFFPDQYRRYKTYLEEDNIVIISGRVNINETNQGGIIVGKLDLIENVVKNKTLLLLFEEGNEDKKVELVKNILFKNQGKTRIKLYFFRNGQQYMFNENYTVNLEDKETLRKLENVVGRSNMKII